MSITHFQFASRLRGSFAGVLEQQCREVSSKHQRLGRWGVRESQDHWWSLVTSPGSLHVAIGCLVSVIVHSFRYKNLARTRLKKVLPWEGVCPPSYLHCASPCVFYGCGSKCRAPGYSCWLFLVMNRPRNIGVPDFDRVPAVSAPILSGTYEQWGNHHILQCIAIIHAWCRTSDTSSRGWSKRIQIQHLGSHYPS